MKHCFHGDGTVLTSYPEQSSQVCCFCGKSRTIQKYRLASMTGHGPFKAQWVGWPPDQLVPVPDSKQPFAEEECPARVDEPQPVSGFSVPLAHWYVNRP